MDTFGIIGFVFGMLGFTFGILAYSPQTLHDNLYSIREHTRCNTIAGVSFSF